MRAIIALIMTVCLLSSCSNNKAIEKTVENYGITEQYYTKRTEIYGGRELDIDIYYPVITGFSDKERQDKINKLLKDEAFARFNDWPDYETALKNVSLSVEYDILFQGTDYLCINYSGMYIAVGNPYPNHLFETIIVDMNAGTRLRLSDMVNVNDSFVQTVMGYFELYIDNKVQNITKFANELQNDPEYVIVYEQALGDYDDDVFLYMLLKADDDNSDIDTYFTDDVFGLRFSTQFAAGSHYEIEIKRADMEKHMVLFDLWG